MPINSVDFRDQVRALSKIENELHQIARYLKPVGEYYERLNNRIKEQVTIEETYKEEA